MIEALKRLIGRFRRPLSFEERLQKARKLAKRMMAKEVVDKPPQKVRITSAQKGDYVAFIKVESFDPWEPEKVLTVKPGLMTEEQATAAGWVVSVKETNGHYE